MKNKMIGYKALKFFVGPFFKLYYNPIVIGAENIPKKGAILVVGNHRHALDQHNIVISTKRPIRYMAKREYFDGTESFFKKTNKLTLAVTKWFIKTAGCIRVDRNVKDTDASNAAIEVLNNGEAIGLFPEGTRNKTDKLLLPFKFGAVSMAQKTNATLVPFGVTGEYKFRSKNLIIRVGKPFKVGDMSLEEANKKLEKVIGNLVKQNLKETNSDK